MKVEYKKWVYHINNNLINDTNKDDVKETYISLFKLFEKSEGSPNIGERFLIVQELENLEYKMQELFGFKVDRDFHKYWKDLTGCLCPRLDNLENFGTPYRITTDDCPYHGTEIVNYSKRLEKLKRIIE